MQEAVMSGDTWSARYNYMNGATGELQKLGWRVDVISDEYLVLSAEKDYGSYQEDYHWELMDDPAWADFRDFVRAERRYAKAQQ